MVSNLSHAITRFQTFAKVLRGCHCDQLHAEPDRGGAQGWEIDHSEGPPQKRAAVALGHEDGDDIGCLTVRLRVGGRRRLKIYWFVIQILYDWGNISVIHWLALRLICGVNFVINFANWSWENTAIGVTWCSTTFCTAPTRILEELMVEKLTTRRCTTEKIMVCLRPIWVSSQSSACSQTLSLKTMRLDWLNVLYDWGNMHVIHLFTFCLSCRVPLQLMLQYFRAVL